LAQIRVRATLWQPAGRMCHDRSMAGALNLDELQALLRARDLTWPILYRPSTPSTMDDARRAAEEGAAEGTVALADEQTAGRGRFGRRWVSPAGVNLYLTLVLRPDPPLLRTLSVIAPLAICLAIEGVAGVPAYIKWPNDVLLGEPRRKAAGVLIDAELMGDEVRYALVGLGVNVNLEPSRYAEIRDLATSVREAAGRPVSREELLASLLHHVRSLYEAARRGEPVHPGWRQRLDTLGRAIRVTGAAGTEEGVAIAALADGRLVLRRDDGTTVALDAGEVSLRG